MFLKRGFDILFSLVGLILLSPFFLIIAILIKLDSPGCVFFLQTRVGQYGRPFRIVKFRTMVSDAERRGVQVSTSNDARITRLGYKLRRFKVDELPQLFNVLLGQMSLVGPRPEVPRYVELYKSDYEEILKVRPGITDYAAIEYRDENTLLEGSENPEETYINEVLPRKIELYRHYINNRGFVTDVILIFKTISASFKN